MTENFFEIIAKVKSLVSADTLTAYSFSTNNCVFCTFISPINTFSPAVNRIVYKPSQGTIRESTYVTKKSKKGIADSGGK